MLSARKIAAHAVWAVLLVSSQSYGDDPPMRFEVQTDTAQTAPSTRPAPGSDLPELLLDVANALTLSDNEAAAISGVVDRAGLYDRTEPMYMLLSHLDRVPKLSPAQLAALQRVPSRIFRRHPADYRAEPVRVTMAVRRVLEMSAGRQLPPSSYWSPQRPIYVLIGLDVTAPVPIEEPLFVLSIVDPRPELGSPRHTDEDGALVYGPPNALGPRLDLACVFYKLMRDPSAKDPNHDYPVLLAWDIQSGEQRSSASGLMDSPGLLLLGVLVIAALLWFMFRAARSYRHLSTPAGKLPRRQRPDDKPPASDEPVDPALRQAVEDYQKERQPRDEPDGKG
jgi:hypothetical protein